MSMPLPLPIADESQLERRQKGTPETEQQAGKFKIESEVARATFEIAEDIGERLAHERQESSDRCLCFIAAIKDAIKDSSLITEQPSEGGLKRKFQEIVDPPGLMGKISKIAWDWQNSETNASRTFSSKLCLMKDELLAWVRATEISKLGVIDVADSISQLPVSPAARVLEEDDVEPGVPGLRRALSRTGSNLSEIAAAEASSVAEASTDAYLGADSVYADSAAADLAHQAEPAEGTAASSQPKEQLSQTKPLEDKQNSQVR